MRIGVVGYSDLNSGIGLFVYEFMKYLPGDSLLSVKGAKGPQLKFAERQISTNRPPKQAVIAEYLDTFKPEVVLFIETPFNDILGDLARERGIKTVGIPMHETLTMLAFNADMFICPSHKAWEKSQGDKYRCLFLPIGLELFPYRERTGHTFVMALGYDGMRDRRQSAATIEAFCSFDDPDMRMIVHTQTNIPGRIADPRITYIKANHPEPKDLYAEGDIFLAPIAYGGYERTILEAMASGMPCLTTNGDPMNLFQHDPDLLVEPCNKYTFSQSYVSNTLYNEVSVESMVEKIAWLKGIDTAEYSRRSRAQAVAQSWECEEIDYRGTWLKALAEA